MATKRMNVLRGVTAADKERARLYARVVWMTTQGYSQKLEESREIDFDSMIADAVRPLAGHGRKPEGSRHHK